MAKKKYHRIHKVPNISDSRARSEIARAHFMIALLGLISVTLLLLLNDSVDLPIALVVVATVLLVLVTLISAGIVATIFRLAKK